jgi:hypothetical protein
MTKIIVKSIGLALFSLLMVGCSDIEKVGPEQQALYSKVVVLTPLSADNTNPNFSVGQKVAFTATFERDTYWKLKLKSRTSGAIKVFEGIGTQIDPSRIVWNGTANGPESFATGDSVYAVVTFPYSPDDSMVVKMRVAVKPNLNTNAVVVSKFANALGWNYDYPGTNTSTTYGVSSAVFPLVDGNSFFNPKLTPNGTSTYIGYAGVNSLTSTYFPLYADASKVYFNMFVYNTGVNIRVQLEEEQNGAARSYEIVPDWTGWKLVSINYLDFTPTELTTPNNPTKVNNVGLVFFSKTLTSSPLDVVVDNITFTNGAPYQP